MAPTDEMVISQNRLIYSVVIYNFHNEYSNLKLNNNNSHLCMFFVKITIIFWEVLLRDFFLSHEFKLSNIFKRHFFLVLLGYLMSFLIFLDAKIRALRLTE